jgi:uncharacterized protein (DUF1800 family)
MKQKIFRLIWAMACALSLAVDLPALSFAAEHHPPFPPSKKDPSTALRASKQSKALKGLPITELTEDEAILHALNRLGYGPRPGDVERVRQMGLQKWIEQQLDPRSIDDHAAEARLEQYPTLKMSSEKLLEEYPPPKQAAKQAGISREEYKREQEERRRAREAQEQQMNEEGRGDPSSPAMERPPKGQGIFGGGDPNNPRRGLEDSRRPQRIIAELSMAKMTRAIYSERQLDEVMADFWFNHFNVFAGKGADRWLVTSYERDVIRPRAMGKFKDLLLATAKSPAMLFYLDNWLSADPKAFELMQQELATRRNRLYGLYGGPFGGMRRWPRRMPPGNEPKARQKRERGLNENYARELMELHTLGVDGGYTQQDVIEVARCFTGWTMRAPRRDPEFFFDERIHDPGTKVVLGKKIHAGGMKDGEEVIEVLARHASTAKFLATKLARRFVSDTPPEALVERMAKTFLASDGDTRAVLKTMIESPEFWSREAYRAKIKTPFELVASTARAVGADVDVALPLVLWTARIGQPLYLCQPPTGYSDKAEAWVNTGALLNRLNFSLALAGGRMRATHVDMQALVGADAASDAKKALARAVEVFLGGQASKQTLETLEKQLEHPEVLQAKLDDPVKQIDVGVIAGLVLGAPEFQRR